MDQRVGRAVGIDLARAGAVVSMYVAHVAPSTGPLGLLEVSEYLTAALFATLVGVGAQLSADRRGDAPWWQVHAVAVARGLALVLVGIMLEQWDAQVVIILIYLGVLTLVMSVLTRLPSWALGALAVVLLLAGPTVRDLTREVWVQRLVSGQDEIGTPVSRALEIFGAGDAYRLVTLLVWGCLGALLVRRWVREGREPSTAELAGTAAVGLGVAGVVLVVARSSVRPYSGEVPEVLLDAALATAVIALALLVGRRVWPGQETTAQLGRMTLSLYVLQVGWLALVARTKPGEPDDSWLTLALLTLVSFLVAAVWPRIVRSGPFARGPFEGFIDLAARKIRPPA